jgi:aminopeptidase-like protein
VVELQTHEHGDGTKQKPEGWAVVRALIKLKVFRKVGDFRQRDVHVVASKSCIGCRTQGSTS